MNPIKAIRERLSLTQAALAERLNCTQGNIVHYEKGQTVPPHVAKRLIEAAATLGVVVRYEEIYGQPALFDKPRRRPTAKTADQGV